MVKRSKRVILYKQKDIYIWFGYMLKYQDNKNLELINVDSSHAHDFRHTMATFLKNSGMPLEEVSALLKHKGVDVTLKHYIKQDK